MANPQPILELIHAFRRSKTMFTAVKLGIFDGARPAGVAVERLMEACVALGLLEKRGGEFVNTAVADEYLRRDSPRSLSGYIRYSNAVLYPLWEHLEEAVMEGSNRWTQTFGAADALFSHFYRTEETRRDFLHGMHGIGVLSSARVAAAFDLSRFRRLVDLGGGTGHLATALRARYPELRAAVFDLPGATAVTRDYVSEEIELVAGDFFIDALPPADLFALGRILHDWSDEKIRLLLQRIYAALPDQGALLIAERLLDEDRAGPVDAHMQSLNMLVCTEGRERTLSEYAALLAEAGFQKIEGRVTGAPLDAIFAQKS